MTERFRNPVIKYTTDTLKTLPNAQLFFYQNGTSTLKTVYKDKNKVTPHSNPVVADSAGIFEPIFLDGTYRVTLKSSVATSSVVQTGWPVDNVGGEDTVGAFDPYSAITSYDAGALVTGTNGLRYQSSVNTNLNNDPTIAANIPTYWTEVRFSDNWDALSVYFVGDRVFYNDDEYYSLQDSNVGHTPSSNSAWFKKIYESYAWNSSTAYASGAYVYDGDFRYISKQSSNTGNQPSTDTSQTWWKPSWQENTELTTVQALTGGGNLSAYKTFRLNDSGTYTLPLASTVPAGGFIIAGKSDTYKAQNPIVQRSGTDTILYNGGTDTSITFNAIFTHYLIFKSNGSNQWEI